MAKVYIVQENPNVNVIGAGRFGELIPMLPPGRQITLSPAPVVRLLKNKLKDFSDEDFLLAMEIRLQLELRLWLQQILIMEK